MSVEFRAHGGLSSAMAEAHGWQLGEVLDCSASTNVYGPSEGMRRAIAQAPIDQYPDPESTHARQVMAGALECSVDEIVLGNGAADLLWSLAQQLSQRGPAVYAAPAFCEFRAAWESQPHAPACHRVAPLADLSLDLPGLRATCQRVKARAVYLCSPNTPTGEALPASRIATLANALPDATFVLDQSFLSLSRRWEEACVRMPSNVICVRSLTKDHGIPGVRVGFALGEPKLLARISQSRPAWTVSAAAQRAAEYAFTKSEQRFVADCRARLLSDCDALRSELKQLGLAPRSSDSVFVLLPVDDADSIESRLISRHGVKVRSCRSFGLPQHLRIAARGAPARRRLFDALQAELGSAGGAHG